MELRAPALTEWCEMLRTRLRGVLEVAVVARVDEGLAALAMAPASLELGKYAKAADAVAGRDSGLLQPMATEVDGVAEVIAYPVGPMHVALIGLAELPERQLQLIMQQVQLAAGWVWWDIVREAGLRAEARSDRLQGSFELFSELLDAGKVLEMQQLLCSIVADRMGASRVSLVMKNWRGKVRLRAVSGTTTLDRRTTLNDLTEQAGAEAIARREAIVHHEGDGGGPLRSLARMHEDKSAASVPLSDARGRVRGALVIEWPERVGDDMLSDWSSLWILAAPAIELRRRANRNIFQVAGSSIGAAFGALLGKGHLWLKAGTVAVLALAALMYWGTGTLTLRADTVIDDTGLRIVSTPADGFLSEVRVIPGDEVTPDTVIAVLDDSDLRLRQLELEAQAARYRAEEAIATRQADQGAVAVARAQTAEVEARLSLLERELEQTVIRAGTTGLVLQGDLRQRIGGQVERGEALMEIAPRQDVEVRVDVANRDGDELVPGLTGTLRLNVAPETPLAIEVIRVKPAAESVDGELRFVGYARIAQTDIRLENGMQGAARLQLGEAPLWRIWLLPAWETLYLFLWSWLP